MKKIINGKKYDTETAKAVGERQQGYPGDLNYFRETLFLKKTGELFLYGEGGANSKYNEKTAENSWSGSEKIILLTESEAKTWAEYFLSADEYEEIFGEVEE